MTKLVTSNMAPNILCVSLDSFKGKPFAPCDFVGGNDVKPQEASDWPADENYLPFSQMVWWT